MEGGVGGRHLGPPGDGRAGGRGEGGTVTTKYVVDVAPGEAAPGQLTVAQIATEVSPLPARHKPPGENPGGEAGLLHGVRAGGRRGPVEMGGGQGEVRAA